MNNHLSDEQKHVLFDKGTERPFSGALLEEKRNGTFACANCGNELFTSDTKFESGSGWPSFTEPKNRENVRLETDVSMGMNRTEVTCAKCGGHLGHVFDDGPTDRGGQRYCINSLSLQFDLNEK
ncbi:MAG TPA: peptide-methionine (R)-S-oxide reductase MsrB [Candidatus Saccharimonadales bacterium]